MKKKAVSNMLGAIILIMIVIAGFSFLVAPTLQRFITASTGAGKGLQTTTQSSGIQTALVDQFTSTQNGQLQITLYVYNYGYTTFTPTQFIVNAAGTNYEVNTFSMVYSGGTVSSIAPGQTVEITFSIPYSGAAPSTYAVSAIGNGISITWNA